MGLDKCKFMIRNCNIGFLYLATGMSRLTIVVAATRSNGIGSNSRLPWRLPKELKYFAQLTSIAPEGKKNYVVMGRNTWESIPKKFRPLPNRMNVVITRNPSYDLGTDSASVVVRSDLTSALSFASNLHRGFIIGGAQIYSEALALSPSATEPSIDRILLTRVLSPDFDCDIFLDDFQKDDKRKWKRASHDSLQEWVGFEVPEGEQEDNGIKYEFQMWIRG